MKRIGSKISDIVWDQVRGQVWKQIIDQVRGRVYDQLYDRVLSQVRGRVWDRVRIQVRGRDLIDGIVSELYYDIREVATEQLEEEHSRAR